MHGFPPFLDDPQQSVCSYLDGIFSGLSLLMFSGLKNKSLSGIQFPPKGFLLDSSMWWSENSVLPHGYLNMFIFEKLILLLLEKEVKGAFLSGQQCLIKAPGPPLP